MEAGTATGGKTGLRGRGPHNAKRIGGTLAVCLVDERDHTYAITQWHHGRKWDTSCGSPQAPFPPRNYGDTQQQIPPVQ